MSNCLDEWCNNHETFIILGCRVAEFPLFAAFTSVSFDSIAFWYCRRSNVTFLLSQHLYSSNWGDYAISTLSVVLDFVRLHTSFAIRPIISLAASLQLVLDMILLWFNWIIFLINSGYFTVMLTKPPSIAFIIACYYTYNCSGCYYVHLPLTCLLVEIPSSCWIFE